MPPSMGPAQYTCKDHYTSRILLPLHHSSWHIFQFVVLSFILSLTSHRFIHSFIYSLVPSFSLFFSFPFSFPLLFFLPSFLTPASPSSIFTPDIDAITYYYFKHQYSVMYTYIPLFCFSSTHPVTHTPFHSLMHVTTPTR